MLDQHSILILEDNAFVALGLALTVERLGGQVVGPVGHVVDALPLVAEGVVTGAILDCELADDDLAPVLAVLVELDVPLVVYSATGLPEPLARSHPDIVVLRKPLPLDEVVDHLVALISNEEPNSTGTGTFIRPVD